MRQKGRTLDNETLLGSNRNDIHARCWISQPTDIIIEITSDEAFVARICDVDMQKDSSFAGVDFVDIPVSDVPTDRSQRYKWRIKDRGGRKGVEVDPTAPDPPTRVP